MSSPKRIVPSQSVFVKSDGDTIVVQPKELRNGASSDMRVLVCSELAVRANESTVESVGVEPVKCSLSLIVDSLLARAHCPWLFHSDEIALPVGWCDN
jgi:hypothetical protein